jgi:hypothetical protein
MTDCHLVFGTTLRKRKNLFLIIFVWLVALIMFLAWPTTTAQSPFWEVRVVNEAGQPIEGMTVTLTYQNYSAEPEGHSEQKQTDAGGYVVFSPRSLKASRWRRIVTTLQSATAGVHASFGPHAWVMAYGNGLDGIAVSNGYVTDWTGAPSRMASRIVAKPRR